MAPPVPVSAAARHPPCTIRDLLASSLRDYAADPAILAPDREPLSYAGLERELDAVANALAEAGYGRASRIAVALPDGPECAVALLAVCSAAACAVISSELDEATVSGLIASMRIDAIIAPEAGDSPAIRAARRARIPIIALHRLPDAPAGSFTLDAPPRGPAVDVVPPEADDIALVTHTSGTTGKPKIVPHTQRSIAGAARARVELGQITRRDRSLLMMPLGSVTSLRRAVLPPLVMGGSVICAERVDPALFIDCLERYAPTHYMTSVAAQIAFLDALERRPHPVAHSLRFAMAGGSRLPDSVRLRLERVLGVPVIQGYGITETGNIAQMPLPPERAPTGSAGRPTNNVDIAIMDESGVDLGIDAIGEIVVRGPEVFAGYEDNPEANARAFRDGWFRSGDLGRIDSDGFLYVLGRIKDVINRGGAKVSPSDVEEALARHPQVTQVAAFALPHPTLGEDVEAAVVLRDDANVTEDDLRDFARSQLAAYKVPTRILAVSRLPRGAFDKVKRDELANLAAQRLQEPFVAARDDGELALTRIFAETLGVDRVGALDNFFQLGGDSLRGMRAMARIHSEFAVLLGVEALFRRPTAAALVVEIREAKARGTSDGPVALRSIRHPT